MCSKVTNFILYMVNGSYFTEEERESTKDRVILLGYKHETNSSLAVTNRRQIGLQT